MKKLLKNKKFLFSLAGLFSAAAAAQFFFSKHTPASHGPETAEELFQETKNKMMNQNGQAADASHVEKQDASLAKELNPAKAFVSVLSKVDDLAQLDVENRRLRIENMNLREWSEALAYDCRAIHAERKTQDLEMELSDRTGALVGRLLESVDYRPPLDKSGVELYTLGSSYFKSQDFERAAVIFAYLVRAKKYEKFRTPESFLTAGVSLYKIDHYKLAELQFAEVLNFKADTGPEGEAIRHYQAQARLWRGLVADRLDNYGEAQKWLKALVDHHPHSVEAAWINGENIDRLPGSTFNPQQIKPLSEDDIIEEAKEQAEPQASSETLKAHGGQENSEDEHH